MMTNESSLMLHTALSGSSINPLELDSTDPKDLFSYKTVLGSNSPEKAIVGEKRTFPLYPLQKSILLYILLVINYHVIYGLSLVQRLGLVRELSNIMILIFFIFRVGDLLLNLLMRSFYPPKSILRTRVPTIGSVRFLLLRNVTPR